MEEVIRRNGQGMVFGLAPSARGGNEPEWPAREASG